MSVILFTGGGTGGHIFPGLAIVDELRALVSSEIVWIGSSRGIDRELVEGHGVRFFGIPSGKLRRYFSFSNLFDVFRIVAGFFSALFLLIKIRPVLVFSKGGFVSVPPCLAAWFLRIPVITHECDFSPGLATRLNARFVTDIFVSYEETVQAFPQTLRTKITVTGNPVRPVFYTASAEKGRSFLGCADNTVPILFVQGGSLGARQINVIIAGCLEDLCKNFIVVHQTGSQNTDQAIGIDTPLVRERYKMFPFIREQMADVLAASEIVVARSGANTVWECAAQGKPMVLIPLEKGCSRGDQVENARFFVSRGAAVMLTGTDASPEKLVHVLSGLLANPKVHRDMADNCRALGSNRSATLIAGLIASRVTGGGR